jgi:CubicO group peptidase (beta-lactamase class C family)
MLVLLAVLGAAGAASAQTSLNDVLQPCLARYELPALAAAVVRNGTVIAAGAVGTRRAGANIPVTLHDRFHLGSDTKAMTALVAGTLVDQGTLRWTSTPADVFPELADRMDTRFRRVTLEQLLSHTSGLAADNEAFAEILVKSAVQEGNLDDLRYWLVQEWGARPLEAEPATRFAYSNMGYTIAGAMTERAAGKTWEELIRERLFVPLGLRTAGLGPQATLGRIDAPLGHALAGGTVKAYLAGPDGDNPAIIGPAGLAHMSVLDFARWAGWNAGQGRRGPRLVRAALGWAEVTVEWSPRPFLFHGGSNQKNLAHIWLDPQRDVAMVLMTNIPIAGANDALMGLAPALHSVLGGGRPAPSACAAR